MKHVDMIPLMGKVVIVHAILTNRDRSIWYPQRCPPWSGWIVGFSYRKDGQTDYCEDYGNQFVETSRQPCVLITAWPTKRPVPVPLDGYTIGGEPLSPDYGGWRNLKRQEAAEKVKVPF